MFLLCRLPSAKASYLTSMLKLTGFCTLPCTLVKHQSIYAKIRLSFELDYGCGLWEYYKCQIAKSVSSVLTDSVRGQHNCLGANSLNKPDPTLCPHTVKINCIDFKVFLISVFRCDVSIINRTRIPSPHLMKNCHFHIPFGAFS